MMKHAMEPGLLHGGDYNPEQWLEYPDILEEDIRYMKKAGCNTMTLGVFSWSALEPEEGIYTFEWLEKIIDRLYENDIFVILATPSASRPKWLSDRYPEVLRVNDRGERMRYGGRHNHCFTSPVYRKKAAAVNAELAKRFAAHPAVLCWHISNELSGGCFCPYCQEAFRNWLKKKYETVELLNEQWCSRVWSHNYRSFDQIEAPSSAGESLMQGLRLDWNRFMTDQTVDFVRMEKEAVRQYGCDKPVTVNMMYYFEGLNYYRFKDVIEIASWDNYPTWHKREDEETAMRTGLYHDVIRSILRRPFLMMESAPGQTSWQPVSKLKKPGMHRLSTLQAIAHGADGALYFQWRQCLGGPEKFHSAVLDHCGNGDTRIFREVAEVGAILKKLSEVKGSRVKADVAILYDIENRWAMENSRGPRNDGLGYIANLRKHYDGVRRLGLNADFIDMECSLTEYKVVIAPMLYMFRAGIEDNIRQFVSQGGIFVLGHWSGAVNENDLCFRAKRPFGLTDVLGLSCSEIDGLFEGEANRMLPEGVWKDSFRQGYDCHYLCELADLSGAETMLSYGRDFYQGKAVVTRNVYGNGLACFIGTDAEKDFYRDFYALLLNETEIKRTAAAVPEGVEITTRYKENTEYIFLQNFNGFRVPFPEIKVPAIPLYGAAGEWLEAYETVVLKS